MRCRRSWYVTRRGEGTGDGPDSSCRCLQNVVRDKIGGASGKGTLNERRKVLRDELDEIRGQQSNNKASRGKILDQVKTIQDGIQKKVRLRYTVFSTCLLIPSLDQGPQRSEGEDPLQDCL